MAYPHRSERRHHADLLAGDKPVDGLCPGFRQESPAPTIDRRERRGGRVGAPNHPAPGVRRQADTPATSTTSTCPGRRRPRERGRVSGHPAALGLSRVTSGRPGPRVTRAASGRPDRLGSPGQRRATQVDGRVLNLTGPSLAPETARSATSDLSRQVLSPVPSASPPPAVRLRFLAGGVAPAALRGEQDGR